MSDTYNNAMIRALIRQRDANANEAARLYAELAFANEKAEALQKEIEELKSPKQDKPEN